MAIKYGEFTFHSKHGFTGSASSKHKVKGYAEGGMRSESTEVAKASRRVQDDAFAPAKQLNKSLKNLDRVRKETGYGADEDVRSYAKGGIKKFTPNEDPNQLLLGDIKPVTQRDLLELEGNKPLRGRGVQKPSHDLFQPLQDKEPDLFKKRGGSVQYARGGKFGMRKTRSDKGMTKEIPGAKMGAPIGGASMPGQIGPASPESIETPSPISSFTTGNTMKMGGRAKRR